MTPASLFHPRGSLSTPVDLVHVDPAIADWEYSGLTVFRLDAGQERSFTLAGVEAAVLPLDGSGVVKVDGTEYVLTGRSDIFRQRTDFVYAPLGAEVTVTADRPGEFALCTSRATTRLDAQYVAAAEVAVEVRGGGVVTRQINNFMAVGSFEADSLIAVEVITPSGNISSYPPHKHDEATEIETQLEEIYYFRIDGSDGFGLFRGYAKDGSFDETVTVADGDVFLVPEGYHGPAVALPGYHMYYLNVMAGPERRWMFTDDPRYGWQRAEIDGRTADPRLPLNLDSA